MIHNFPQYRKYALSVCLGTIYLAETENFFVESIVDKAKR